jgi:glycosyltransferase involved in cell wall biosynthesis
LRGEGLDTEVCSVIVGLFPQLSGAGGVQRAGQLTAAALTSFASEHLDSCVFLSLNDSVGTTDLQMGGKRISFTGFGRSKRRFVSSAWHAAGRRPNLVVALHPNLAPVVTVMKLRSARTRTIVFAHGVEVSTPLIWLRRWSLRHSDLTLGPSLDTVRQLIKVQGTAQEKTAKLAWSLGLDFDPRAVPNVAHHPPDGFPGGRIILTVGRWDAGEAYKGVDHLIAALPKLLEDVHDLHLVAVGEGSDLSRLVQYARQSRREDRIHFLPFLEPAKLKAAYDCCDVFALPSRGEGFGLVFLEAMSCGKPVVGGAHGGIPDVIEDGVTGYLVRHGDVPALVDRLRRLLTDDSLRCRMGAAARERVLRHFTFERFSTEFAAKLGSLMAVPR